MMSHLRIQESCKAMALIIPREMSHPEECVQVQMYALLECNGRDKAMFPCKYGAYVIANCCPTAFPDNILLLFKRFLYRYHNHYTPNVCNCSVFIYRAD